MSFSKYPSVVITCHGSADYDAVGALLAAQKMYQDSVILLPGSGIKNVKHFFISSMCYLLNVVKPDQVNYENTSCLVVVGKELPDSFFFEGLEPLLQRLQKKGLPVHWYSNINDSGHGKFCLVNGQISPDRLVFRPYGSVSTLMTEMLREKNMPLGPEEATIMALGIYEGTGVFTRPGTVAMDMEQAGYLLSCGANLSTIVSLVTQDMTMGFLPLVNELTDKMRVHKINGQNVHISTGTSVVSVDDLSPTIWKMKQMQKLDIFFAIVLMDRTIYVAGATDLPVLDIQAMLSLFNGADYISDDCIAIKDSSLSDIETELMGLLKNHLRPPRDARSLMAAPAIIIAPGASCKEASALMTRYNINTLLVVDAADNTYEGYITRQIAEKTLYHGLGHQPVSAYMNHETSWVSPDAQLSEVEQKIMDGNQRVVPVISEKGILGVITRTDLFSYLFRYNKTRNAQEKELFAQHTATRCGVGEMMTQRLSPKMLKLLKSFGKVGEEMGVGIYAVGGFVRDLVLDEPVDDLDIVVEGDAISFARYFAKRAGCQVQSHEKFSTAVIVFPDQFKVDAASARREYYTNPAALPIVEQSSIKMDLARRDFTINTLAIHLNPDHFGTMIDHFGALEDIREKTIRVIHNLSFVEDPTRIFRAIRFASRFGFSIGKNTRKLIRNTMSIDGFKNVTGTRVFSEIKQILCASNPLPATELMGAYDLQKVIHKDLMITSDLCNRFASIRKVLVWHETLYPGVCGCDCDSTNCDNEKTSEDSRQIPDWMFYFMGILFGCSRKMCQEISCRLMMSGREIRWMLENRFRAEEVLGELEKSFPMPDHELYWKVVEIPSDLVLYLIAITARKDLEKALMRFYTEHRIIKTAIRGKDLVQMKIPPGPVYKKIMNQIINGRIQGTISSREQELNLVRDYITATGRLGISSSRSDHNQE